MALAVRDAKKFFIFLSPFIRDEPRQAATTCHKLRQRMAKARYPILDTRCSTDLSHPASRIQRPASRPPASRIQRPASRPAHPIQMSKNSANDKRSLVRRDSTEGRTSSSMRRIAAPWILSSTFYQYFCELRMVISGACRWTAHHPVYKRYNSSHKHEKNSPGGGTRPTKCAILGML